MMWTARVFFAEEGGGGGGSAELDIKMRVDGDPVVKQLKQIAREVEGMTAKLKESGIVGEDAGKKTEQGWTKAAGGMTSAAGGAKTAKEETSKLGESLAGLAGQYISIGAAASAAFAVVRSEMEKTRKVAEQARQEEGTYGKAANFRLSDTGSMSAEMREALKGIPTLTSQDAAAAAGSVGSAMPSWMTAQDVRGIVYSGQARLGFLGSQENARQIGNDATNLMDMFEKGGLTPDDATKLAMYARRKGGRGVEELRGNIENAKAMGMTPMEGFAIGTAFQENDFKKKELGAFFESISKEADTMSAEEKKGKVPMTAERSLALMDPKARRQALMAHPERYGTMGNKFASLMEVAREFSWDKVEAYDSQVRTVQAGSPDMQMTIEEAKAAARSDAVLQTRRRESRYDDLQKQRLQTVFDEARSPVAGYAARAVYNVARTIGASSGGQNIGDARSAANAAEEVIGGAVGALSLTRQQRDQAREVLRGGVETGQAITTMRIQSEKGMKIDARSLPAGGAGG